ncbi:MAG TPA: tetratricopeptide repeat protein, partial [Blastocatellia bacterium]|nr:tetratricopeptide repeat protein [Blastocatellia bacterium]
VSNWAENRKKWAGALRATLPAFVITAAVAGLIWKMTPATFEPGASSAALYRITQPLVALRYFKSFFLPTELTADSDWTVVSSLFSTEAMIGFCFVIGMVWVAARTSRNPMSRPISFGLVWFLLALFPTSITALAEVTNDHRMFFPFIGLALAASWAVRLLLFQKTERLSVRPELVWVSVIAVACILIAAAAGTWQRNRVWHSDDSLWLDVTLKSPKNGRGLMNYGLTQMDKGDYTTALEYFERAQSFTPAYSLLEINLGIAYGGLNRDAEANRHFQRALQLAPNRAEPHYFYGRWLNGKGRIGEAIAQLEAALRANPYAFDARHLLMNVYASQGNTVELQRVTEDTLRLAPNDAVAKQFIATRQNREQEIAAAEQAVRQTPTPERLLTLSWLYYQAGRFPECIQTAGRALQLKPDYAEAYNNMAAGYNSLGLWEDGIKAAAEAIRLKPDFELAKNNLAYAMSQRQHSAPPAGAPAPAATAPSPGAVPARAGAQPSERR